MTEGGEHNSTRQGPPPVPSHLGEALAPVGAGERNPSLDVLRGLALLGILIVNMVYFSDPTDELAMCSGLLQSDTDTAAEFFSLLFVEGKFYPLFSLLFGLGFAIQLQRARERGKPLGQTYTRRLLLLMGIGFLHGIFLWDGDVLFLYGLCGFLLLCFKSCKPKTLIIWAGSFIALQGAMLLLLGAFIWILESIPSVADEIEEALAEDPSVQAALNKAFVSGGYWNAVAYRAIHWIETVFTLMFLSLNFIAMFLVGLHPKTRQVMADPCSNRPWLKKCALCCGGVGLAIGLPAAAIGIIGLEMGGVGMYITYIGMASLSGPLLTLAYVAVFLLCSRPLLKNRVVLAIGKTGRMALTNYLLQSLIATSLFYGYGLGWGGSMGRTETMLVALGIFLVQVLFSLLWLSCFRFGPMEWLWRSLTYGKAQAMKITRN